MMPGDEGAIAIKWTIKWSTVNMRTLKGGKKILPHFNVAPEHFNNITALLHGKIMIPLLEQTSVRF